MTPFVAPDPVTLQAVSVPLPPGPAIDPVSVLDRDGVLFHGPDLTLAGRGVAARLVLPGGLDDHRGVVAVGRWLAEVVCEDRVACRGSGVVAQAALPFDRLAAGTFIVPSITYGRSRSRPHRHADDGDHTGEHTSDNQAGDDRPAREWLTFVSPVGRPVGSGLTISPLPDLDRPETLRQWFLDLIGEPSTSSSSPTSPPVARSASVMALPLPELYAESVAQAVVELEGPLLRKVVLARCLDLQSTDPIDAAAVVRRLHRQEPSCTAFSHPTGAGRFVGTSPELLVAREGRTVRCHPLAGTVALDRSPDAPSEPPPLLSSPKDQVEHRVVVEEIAAALDPLCDALVVPDQPTLVRLHTVAHLGTEIEGDLAGDDDVVPTALELLALLHPTPAVGGVPRQQAIDLIEKLEASPRGHWAGPVGWVDRSGDGEWMIGIRSATLTDDGAHLCAGAGIVTGSVPAAELAETTIKLRPVLEAVLPGAGVLLGH